MHVNCAHGKGIKFIREELKFFAKSNVQSNTGILFKTIVLLNADNLTIDAQSALRRCIELFSSNTRFFIIVENKNKLLNPILSRFCEIYVPEYMSGGKLVNLNQLSVGYEISASNTIEKQVSDKMTAFINTKDSICVHSLCVDIANEFYENGVSCLDMIKWIEKTDTIDSKTRSSTLMYFDEIKFEYRCEKLLMLCLFDYLSIY
jgi:hypothetical protein